MGRSCRLRPLVLYLWHISAEKSKVVAYEIGRLTAIWSNIIIGKAVSQTINVRSVHYSCIMLSSVISNPFGASSIGTHVRGRIRIILSWLHTIRSLVAQK